MSSGSNTAAFFNGCYRIRSKTLFATTTIFQVAESLVFAIKALACGIKSFSYNDLQQENPRGLRRYSQYRHPQSIWSTFSD